MFPLFYENSENVYRNMCELDSFERKIDTSDVPSGDVIYEFKSISEAAGKQTCSSAKCAQRYVLIMANPDYSIIPSQEGEISVETIDDLYLYSNDESIVKSNLSSMQKKGLCEGVSCKKV